jgi:hypothetical protein
VNRKVLSLEAAVFYLLLCPVIFRLVVHSNLSDMRSIPAGLENQANSPCRGANNRVDCNGCRNTSGNQIDPCIAVPAPMFA